jgi:hypothetical protein
VDSVRVLAGLFGYILVVVRVVVYLGTDDDRLVHPVLIHLEEELFDATAAFIIRDWRLIGPAHPSMAMTVDDHLFYLLRAHRLETLMGKSSTFLLPISPKYPCNGHGNRHQQKGQHDPPRNAGRRSSA